MRSTSHVQVERLRSYGCDTQRDAHDGPSMVFVWSMVRFDSNTPIEAAHILLTARARGVCCTGHHSQRSARRARVEIAINILHIDVDK